MKFRVYNYCDNKFTGASVLEVSTLEELKRSLAKEDWWYNSITISFVPFMGAMERTDDVFIDGIYFDGSITIYEDSRWEF